MNILLSIGFAFGRIFAAAPPAPSAVDVPITAIDPILSLVVPGKVGGKACLLAISLQSPISWIVTGGDKRTAEVTIGNLSLGSLPVGESDVASLAEKMRNSNVCGLLGPDSLRASAIGIDFRTNTLRFWPKDVPTEVERWVAAAGRSAISEPFHQVPGTLSLRLERTLGGKTLSLGLGTGGTIYIKPDILGNRGGSPIDCPNSPLIKGDYLLDLTNSGASPNWAWCQSNGIDTSLELPTDGVMGVYGLGSCRIGISFTRGVVYEDSIGPLDRAAFWLTETTMMPVTVESGSLVIDNAKSWSSATQVGGVVDPGARLVSMNGRSVDDIVKWLGSKSDASRKRLIDFAEEIWKPSGLFMTTEWQGVQKTTKIRLDLGGRS